MYLKYCTLRNRLFNINTQRYWNKIWAKEQINLNPYRFYPPAFTEIIKIIPYESKVADIGCGIGILLERLRKERACQVFGVDISQEAILALKRKDIDGIVAKVPPIPLPTESFDIVTATELLEHVNNPYSVIKEMIRIVKSGGY
ncbi:MAG: class I SAM-dependent methyltransferase [Candidatus Omnitrophica bacterium]|nr:class I SAM-dependent methyltransferase [Candidatus Omnitrophota bacterium]